MHNIKSDTFRNGHIVVHVDDLSYFLDIFSASKYEYYYFEKAPAAVGRNYNVIYLNMSRTEWFSFQRLLKKISDAPDGPTDFTTIEPGWIDKPIDYQAWVVVGMKIIKYKLELQSQIKNIEQPPYAKCVALFKIVFVPKYFEAVIVPTIDGCRIDCYEAETKSLSKWYHRWVYVRGLGIIFWHCILAKLSQSLEKLLLKVAGK